MMEELKSIEQESSTDNYLKSLNPELWQKISLLPEEEKYARWLEVTQNHLRSFEKGDLEKDKFKEEELELLFLDTLFETDVSNLPSDLPLGGGFFGEQGKNRFHNFGDFIESLKNEIETDLEGPCNILITGIGVSGKATMRSILNKIFKRDFSTKKIISLDRDYEKLFPSPWSGDINIIEDVHGLDKDEQGKLTRFDGQDGLENGYNLIIYCLPSRQTYWQSLLNRGKGWIEKGKIDLTKPSASQPESVEDTAKEASEKLKIMKKNAKEIISHYDFPVLKDLKKRGIPIVIINPKQIFQNLYGLEIDPGLSNKSFYDKLMQENL